MSNERETPKGGKYLYVICMWGEKDTRDHMTLITCILWCTRVLFQRIMTISIKLKVLFIVHANANGIFIENQNNLEDL